MEKEPLRQWDRVLQQAVIVAPVDLPTPPSGRALTVATAAVATAVVATAAVAEVAVAVADASSFALAASAAAVAASSFALAAAVALGWLLWRRHRRWQG